MGFKISSMENAPKDRRIVAYGVHARDFKPSWATVIWYEPGQCWVCDPNEASEYPKEKSECSLWFDLPQDTGSATERDATVSGQGET